MSTEIAAEDSGNYTCEVNGPLNTVLGVSTHCLYVRGMNQSTTWTWTWTFSFSHSSISTQPLWRRTQYRNFHKTGNLSSSIMIYDSMTIVFYAIIITDSYCLWGSCLQRIAGFTFVWKKQPCDFANDNIDRSRLYRLTCMDVVCIHFDSSTKAQWVSIGKKKYAVPIYVRWTIMHQNHETNMNTGVSARKPNEMKLYFQDKNSAPSDGLRSQWTFGLKTNYLKDF